MPETTAVKLIRWKLSRFLIRTEVIFSLLIVILSEAQIKISFPSIQISLLYQLRNVYRNQRCTVAHA